MARRRTSWDARIALLAALLSVLAGCADSRREPPRRADGEDGGLVIDASSTALAFEPTVLELGRTVPGGTLEGLAHARNVGREPLTVIDYNAPCECTNTSPELPRTLQPGEAFSFPVRLELSGLARGGLSAGDDREVELVERELVLWTRRGKSSELRLVAELSEELVVDPAVLDFGEILRGEPAEGRIRVEPGRARPEEPVAVLWARPEGEGPLPAVEIRPEGPGAELLVRLPGLEEGDDARGRLRLLTDAEPEPILVLWVAQVVDPVVVSPPRIDVPAAPRGRPVLTRLQLRRRDGRPLQVLEAESTSGRLVVRPLGPTGAGTVEVEVVAAVRPWPEETRGEVRLQTDYPGVAGRLTVPVRVREREPR